MSSWHNIHNPRTVNISIDFQRKFCSKNAAIFIFAFLAGSSYFRVCCIKIHLYTSFHAFFTIWAPQDFSTRTIMEVSHSDALQIFAKKLSKRITVPVQCPPVHKSIQAVRSFVRPNVRLHIFQFFILKIDPTICLVFDWFRVFRGHETQRNRFQEI